MPELEFIRQQLSAMTKEISAIGATSRKVEKEVLSIKDGLASVSIKNGGGLHATVSRQEFEEMIYDCVKPGGRIDTNVDVKLTACRESHDNFRKLKIFSGKAGVVFEIVKAVVMGLIVLFILYELIVRKPFLQTDIGKATQTQVTNEKSTDH